MLSAVRKQESVCKVQHLGGFCYTPQARPLLWRPYANALQ